MSEEATKASVYEQVGGMPFFERLVDAFYAGVAGDEVLAPLYPEQPDFTGARHRLALFLAQYWGGPSTYSQERGHPALRMRHMRFKVGPAERDRWLQHMASAVDEVCDDPSIADELMRYFASAAEHLRNDTGLPITPAGYPR
jgi:hemoglobin